MANSADSRQSALTLPKGGGAVQGLGETFTANPQMGAGSFSVPIAVSAGRSGFHPQLTLGYSTGSGNSSFGLGWELSVPRITRKTEKGLPRYDDSDVFVMSGAEELVPQLVRVTDDQGNAAWVTDRGTRGDYQVTRFRPRTEGAFARIERWDRAGDTHWRATTAENITSVYGKTRTARVMAPAADRSQSGERVYEWLLEESFDAKGNHILYEYAQEDPAVVPATIGERNHRHTSQRYLRRIYYGNTPDTLDPAVRIGPVRAGTNHLDHLTSLERHYLFEVVFDYGDLPLAPDLAYQPRTSSPERTTAAWTVRPDPFSSFRSGFDIRTVRRCRRVLVFHHLQELGGTTLIRETAFEHAAEPYARLSLLTAVRATRYRKAAAGDYRSAGLPPISFSYSQFRPLHQRFRSIEANGGDAPPFAIGTGGTTLVDLFGDGLPDVLQASPQGLRYWRNRGGLLERPKVQPVTPGTTAVGALDGSFGDLGGDGLPDLIVQSDGQAGFYEATPEGGWRSFKPFKRVPSVNLASPNVRLVDLTGDGRSDLLVTDDRRFLWLECLGEEGYGEPRSIGRLHDLDAFPDVFFDEPSGRVRLADMNGDGLDDIVLLHNGRADYWPNLGYGRFGRRITMSQSPRLERDFDPARLFLADLDGSGCADLVYVGLDSVHFWFNQSGNGWSAQQTIIGTPAVSDVTQVLFADLYGSGTATLVWSYDAAHRRGGNIKALDFCGGMKPYLLTEMRTSFGATTRVSYAPSTSFFLRDLQQGRPWVTSLPFPVHVVERVETINHINRTKFISRYAYHHGYYDGREREFRGFGRVDQWDTETFDAFTSADDNLLNAHAAYHLPPVETRTWYHTGVYYDENRVNQHGQPFDYAELTEAYRREYYVGDPDAFVLPDQPVERGDQPHAAYRALRGSVLRSEVYAHDKSARATHPYIVTEHHYGVRMLQPRNTNRHAVYQATRNESITYHYERNPSDPRIKHTLTLRMDDYGNVTDSVTVAYPRRAPLFAEQSVPRVVYTRSDVVNRLDDETFYYVGLSCQQRTYDITGMAWHAGRPCFKAADFASIMDGSLTPGSFRPFEWQRPAGHQGIERRLLTWTRGYYRADSAAASADINPAVTPRRTLAGRLPLGVIERLALPYESYQAALTPGLVGQVLNAGGVSRVDGAVLTEAGYHEEPDVTGWWWAPEGQQAFDATRFYQPVLTYDRFGNRSQIDHDRYALLIERIEAPHGNITVAAIDYRMLEPYRLTDPNGVISEVAYNTLGMVAGTATRKGGEGDSLDGFEADLLPQTLLDFWAQPRAQAHALLGNATTRVVYNLDRPDVDGETQPVWTATISREQHVSALVAGQATPVRVAFAYLDGLGRVIQTKLETHRPATGEERWIGSGWTILNNKGNAVRQYEPFFSQTHAFEFNRRLGVSPTQFYDPLQRLVATLYPNHTYSKVVVDPWQQTSWDVNDTVLEADPAADPDVGAFFGPLARGDYLPTWYARRIDGSLGAHEQTAAQRSVTYAATPQNAYFDTVGRTFLTEAHNRTRRDGAESEAHYRTWVDLAVDGNERQVVDALDRVVMRYDYDMIGTHIRKSSMEAGERWTLNDVTGKPYRTWTGRGEAFRTVYDSLRRPTELWLRTATETEILIEQTIYGDDRTDPEANNLRGRPYQVFDGAGVVTNEAYDFKGNLLRSRRQFAVEYKQILDWSAPVALLPEVYATETTYDALNRPTSMRAPDSSLIRPNYNEAGLLKRVGASLRGAGRVTPLVNDIDYDAKGQRTRVDYGNGVRTTYTYDPETYRLVHLLTARGAAFPGDCPTPPDPPCGVQNLRYTHDAGGNITYIRDDAQQTIYFRNRRVEPSADYTYDALYRLIEASGREHLGLTSGATATPTPLTWSDAPRERLVHPGDGNALGRYHQQYTYDAVGNILEMVHRGTDPSAPGWRRVYTYDQSSLLEPSRTSNRLGTTQIGATTTEIYSYDAHGNLTAMSHLPLMRWDPQDRLQATATQVVGGGAVPETTYYVYNTSGQRVRKVTERAVTAAQVAAGERPTRMKERLYLGDWEVYREFGGNGTTLTLARETLHIMDDRQRIAVVETRAAGSDGSPPQLVRFQFGNHLGSAILELDANAEIITYEEYYPHGSTSYQAVRSQTDAPKRYRYTGNERDEESGLYYHGARYYAPWLGRWVACDPGGIEDGVNLYAYVQCNPTALVDPSGTTGEPPQMHLLEQTELRQPVTATYATRGYGAWLRQTYQALGNQWMLGPVDVGDPENLPFALTPPGTTRGLRVQPRAENQSLGST
ncbi:MAG TPA: SpvB/TcaC N-terminal domain-containing protein, partial [Herpetosiphonaceae bacterium]|nr:SpvB/TcaC N-terminal domain-containing protein [Herpetosiphonaceae bacterium]